MSLSLNATRFGLAMHKRNVWHAVLPEGVEYETVFKPAFWAHVASKMRPGDEVIVINDEMTVRAELVVKNAERLWAQLIEVSRVDLTAQVAAPEALADYHVEVKWAGPHDKFRVERVRNGQREVLASGMADKEIAERWRADHLKTIGQKAA
jgi:hypothetical protein